MYLSFPSRRCRGMYLAGDEACSAGNWGGGGAGPAADVCGLALQLSADGAHYVRTVTR